MLGYLMEPKERLRVLKAGMANNTPDWTAKTVELPEVETMLTRIDAKDAEVETARQLLSLRSTEARALSGEAVKLADKIMNIALGIYPATRRS